MKLIDISKTSDKLLINTDHIEALYSKNDFIGGVRVSLYIVRMASGIEYQIDCNQYEAIRNCID